MTGRDGGGDGTAVAGNGVVGDRGLMGGRSGGGSSERGTERSSSVGGSRWRTGSELWKMAEEREVTGSENYRCLGWWWEGGPQVLGTHGRPRDDGRRQWCGRAWRPDGGSKQGGFRVVHRDDETGGRRWAVGGDEIGWRVSELRAGRMELNGGGILACRKGGWRVEVDGAGVGWCSQVGFKKIERQGGLVSGDFNEIGRRRGRSREIEKGGREPEATRKKI